MSGLARLARFVGPARKEERCSLCGVVLEESHPHLVEAPSGKVLCSCTGCSVLFNRAAGRYRSVPDRVMRLTALRMTEEQWERFDVPVGIAFFRKTSSTGRVSAVYPSPLGAVQAGVPSEAWDAIVRDHPELRALEDDVEALLVRRANDRQESFICPLDTCYALIGLMRREWRGFSGGDAVWRSVDRFFGELRERSEVTG